MLAFMYTGFRIFTSIHDRLTIEMNRCLKEKDIPEWMIKIRLPCSKVDPEKGTCPNNYRPIMCLPMMWKILTAQIRQEIYYSLISRELSPEEKRMLQKNKTNRRSTMY